MEFAAVITLLSAIEQLAALVNKARADAQQNAAWTPEQEAEFDAKMQAAFASPSWTPEKRNET